MFNTDYSRVAITFPFSSLHWEGWKSLETEEGIITEKGVQHDSLLYNKYTFVFLVVAFLTDKGRMEYERLYEEGTFSNKTVSRWSVNSVFGLLKRVLGFWTWFALPFGGYNCRYVFRCWNDDTVLGFYGQYDGDKQLRKAHTRFSKQTRNVVEFCGR
jgi:hypothetical protein